MHRRDPGTVAVTVAGVLADYDMEDVKIHLSDFYGIY